jgi:hypothetical protein
LRKGCRGKIQKLKSKQKVLFWKNGSTVILNTGYNFNGYRIPSVPMDIKKTKGFLAHSKNLQK